MCQGLNSHYFHIIGDGHQPNSRGLYTHYKDSHHWRLEVSHPQGPRSWSTLAQMAPKISGYLEASELITALRALPAAALLEEEQLHQLTQYMDLNGILDGCWWKFLAVFCCRSTFIRPFWEEIIWTKHIPQKISDLRVERLKFVSNEINWHLWTLETEVSFEKTSTNLILVSEAPPRCRVEWGIAFRSEKSWLHGEEMVDWTMWNSCEPSMSEQGMVQERYWRLAISLKKFGSWPPESS